MFPFLGGTAHLHSLAVAATASFSNEGGLASTRDPISQLIVGVIIAAVFVLLALEQAHRVLIIFGAVSLLWLITYFTPYHLISFEASQRAIDLNVILLLASMMAVVAVLKSTGVFAWAVARLLRYSGGRPTLIVALLIWFTGLLSSVADNVTTVIFTTPMALELASRLKIRPMALLLPMVMASNIGGTATLIGDPPNILIGSGAGLSFLDFVVNLTAPVLLMLAVLEWFSGRTYRDAYAAGVQRIDPADLPIPALENIPLLRWGIAISIAIFVGFFTHTITGMPAALPAAIGAAALLIAQDVIHLRTRDASTEERIHGILHVIEREIEWPTLSFFALLFIAVGAAVETGLIDTLSRGLAGFIDWGSANLGLGETGTLLFAALLILWVSGALSALIDNIPYVAVTIPIVANLVGRLTGDTEILWWALSLGACLGGNGTAIGASANVTVIGLADRVKEHITFAQFARFGTPVMLLTLLVSTAFISAHLFLGPRTTHVAAFSLLAVVVAGRLILARRRALRAA
ncbi:MAG: SLC13 family permease [Gemmatimonadales bacterium]|nr:SLC13 family permease [Gemmatimonadales bacterium]